MKNTMHIKVRVCYVQYDGFPSCETFAWSESHPSTQLGSAPPSVPTGNGESADSCSSGASK